MNDWEQRYKKWKQRMGPSLRSLEQWTDCKFQVGTEGHLATFPAHKLVMAAASPVFEAMLYGKMADDNEYIRIPDIQPDIFNAILEFIYTDDVTINTVEFANDLYYGAEKYMLLGLVKKCSEYLISKVDSNNVLKLYEFASIFKDEKLKNECGSRVIKYSEAILNGPNFEEIEANTLLTILNTKNLNIPNELTMFSAVERYAKAQQKKFLPDREESVNISASDAKELNSVSDDDSMVNKNTTANRPCKTAEDDKDIPCPSSNKLQKKSDAKDNLDKTIRSALKKIRFLTMTAEEFVEGPAKSSLLNQSEVLAVLMNIVTTEAPLPMPTGWSECREPRENP